MAKFFGKNNLTKLGFFSIIYTTAKVLSCTCKRSSQMKIILSLLILASSTVYAQQSWSGTLGNSISSTTTTYTQQLELIKEAKDRLISLCGDDAVDECKDGTSDRYSTSEGEGCVDKEKKEDQKCCSLCKSYLKLKKAGGFNASTIGSLIGLALQIGGQLLAPGCGNACDKDSTGAAYSPNDKTRCLCQTKGTDGKPCIEPSSSTCKNANTESCADQLTSITFNSDSEKNAVLASCECGKRNSVDPKGGWHINENSNSCVNTNDNNTNNNNANEAFNPAYEKQQYADNANVNGNASTAATAAEDKAAAAAKAALGGASGAKLPTANSDKKNDKENLSAQTGNGAGKSANATAGSSNAYGGIGNGQDFKAKKGEKVKDIAKSDGESIFILVSSIYKSQIDANALDSTRPMKKLDKKAIDKKTSGKKV